MSEAKSREPKALNRKSWMYKANEILTKYVTTGCF